MKEVTYEDWQKNPIPRMMWVWDNDETCKEKIRVIHISKQGVYQVIALADNDIDLCRFKHCAEIEKQRRMTNKELSRWLREKPTREWKYIADNNIYTSYNYEEDFADKESWKEVVVREDDGEWREPLVEDL